MSNIKLIPGRLVGCLFALFFTLHLPLSATEKPEADPKAESGGCGDLRQFTFSWQFVDQCNMRPRGGTSKGEAVTLDTRPHPGWLALQEKELSAFERDRRAILAMAGPYRTSFDFLEVVGYTPDFKADKPYQSWGTEYIYVVEERKDFISLQHIMVMFFAGEGGKVSGPMVMKHWRQDWQYEKPEILVFKGHNTWAREKVPTAAVKGSWSQAVYQVDDSPRYEAYGKWVHQKNFSTWLSSPTWRPLPRREFSVRNDYDVLEGTNRHTIVPSGWVHEEENYKLVLDPQGRPAEVPYLAKELGVNRYERIVEHDFSGGDRYWQASAAFWADVRLVWAELIASNKTLKLKKKVNRESLFMPLFGRAQMVVEEGKYNAKKGRKFIRETIMKYLDT